MSKRVTILPGDCRRAMHLLRRRHIQVDAIVTDPPYHLTGGSGAGGFMGKKWDGRDDGGKMVAFQVETWKAAYRLLKPGGHLIAFSAPRTYHRMACAVEDAGFEIRDSLLDIVAGDTAVLRFLASLTEAQADAFHRCIAESQFGGLLAWVFGGGFPKSLNVPPFCRVETRQTFDGFGTAMKPGFEPMVLARKPLGGTVVDTMLKHGTGALNIDGCRVPTDAPRPVRVRDAGRLRGHTYSGGEDGSLCGSRAVDDTTEGRFPANVLHDGSAEVVAAFPREAGAAARVKGTEASAASNGNVTGKRARVAGAFHGDSGSAARFFYSSKADSDDRLGSKHPTVKPVDLMRWLVRLVTPPGGLVLDPFAGSGTTGMACLAEGLRAILVEKEAEYIADIRRRVAHVAGGGLPLFSGAELS